MLKDQTGIKKWIVPESVDIDEISEQRSQLLTIESVVQEHEFRFHAGPAPAVWLCDSAWSHVFDCRKDVLLFKRKVKVGIVQGLDLPKLVTL